MGSMPFNVSCFLKTEMEAQKAQIGNTSTWIFKQNYAPKRLPLMLLPLHHGRFLVVRMVNL